MFSQFLNPAAPLAAQVLQMALVFVVIGLACHFLWIYAGQLIFGRIRTPRAMRAQGIGFGLCMILVAAFVAFS